MNEYYKEDLAFIYDVGFGEWALKSAPGILGILKQNGIREGLVVDLGCGSGLWARELAKANYEDEESAVLTRRITSFRKAGRHYRRSDEVHRQRLFRFGDVAKELRSAGFGVRTSRSYGQYRLPAAHAVFVARKPKQMAQARC